MFDKFKQSLNQTVNSTKFKADQLLKINNIQGEIGGLQREANTVREQIASTVVELHQRGALPVPELEGLCAQVEALLAQVAEKQRQIEAIRAEPMPGQAPAAAPQQPVYPAQPAPVPAPYPNQVASAVDTKVCPTCQATVPGVVVFCPNCGFNFPPAVAEAAPKTTKTCPSCQYEAPLTSAFCPNCGKPLNA